VSLLLFAAPAAIAYPPSAFDQYTEQPPGDATGPRSGDAVGGGGNGVTGGATYGGPGASGVSGSPAPTAQGGDQAARGEAAGGAGGDAAQGKPGHSPDTTLVADTRPTNSLLWIALLAIAAALLVRAGLATRARLGGGATR